MNKKRKVFTRWVTVMLDNHIGGFLNKYCCKPFFWVLNPRLLIIKKWKRKV